MEYLWLLLGAFIVVCVVALAVSGLVRYMDRSRPFSSPVFWVGGVVLTAAYFISSVPLWTDKNLMLPFAAFLILCGLLLVQLKMTGFVKECCLLLLCGAGCALLPPKGGLFETVGAGWTFPLLAVSLYLMMRLFVIMDRVPWFSNLTLLAQGILILFLLQKGIFPASMGTPLFYAFVATIAVAQTVKVYFGQPVLGDYAAPVAGFALGFLWTMTVAKGYWAIAPILYSYDAFEIGVSFLISSVAARRLSYPTSPFFIERAFATNVNPKRLIRSVFFVLVLISLFALVNLQSEMWSEVLVLLGILLFVTGIRFKRWDVPKVRFRDLGSDLKQGFSELKNEMMYIPLKKNTPRKKGHKK